MNPKQPNLYHDKGLPTKLTEAEEEAAKDFYFKELGRRYEKHKAAGGTVFDFEPNRGPPDFTAASLALAGQASQPAESACPEPKF